MAGRADYFPRAVDQGIGRALWFIHGGQSPDVAAAVGRFATERHADLWSGVGLAATFAGGSDAEGLAVLRREAGACLPQVAQGVVFAAKARDFAGFVPPHTELATEILAGISVSAAAILADDVAADGFGQSAEPDYEVWRQRVEARVGADLRLANPPS
ncbi:hypothetical protein Prum_102070 [Phytohabitans rumicis]|uniref:Uncharacterized protein n=1 Tax=Phytohabitans rumicis TaxID=1076125 RepID=A0A6V8LUV9_9ACTN|nr:hypothetical protein Prum_102070 [Phytohabitans rumicis]